MKKHIIEVQRGLNEVLELLKSNEYECFVSGTCDKEADIMIVDVPNAEYEGISTSSCMKAGVKEKVVINIAGIDLNEVLKTIESNYCKND